MAFVGEVIVPVIGRIVNFNGLVDTDEDVGNCHLIHGKGACLVRADVVCASHDFARCKLLHEVLVNEHFTHGEGKGDHDS